MTPTEEFLAALTLAGGAVTLRLEGFDLRLDDLDLTSASFGCAFPRAQPSD